MASVKIFNVIRPEDAEPIKAALRGQSYMDFHVNLCPIGGSFDVVVETRLPDTSEEEVKDMVLEILCSRLRRAANIPYEYNQDASGRPFL